MSTESKTNVFEIKVWWVPEYVPSSEDGSNPETEELSELSFFMEGHFNNCNEGSQKFSKVLTTPVSLQGIITGSF